MPSRKQHRTAAARRLRAYRHTVDAYPDWASTMLFYSALHLLESAFDASGIHNRTHSEREFFIKANHPQVWPAYHRLQSESMKARYLEGGAFSMNPKGVRAELRRQKWKAIRAYVATLL